MLEQFTREAYARKGDCVVSTHQQLRHIVRHTPPHLLDTLGNKACTLGYRERYRILDIYPRIVVTHHRHHAIASLNLPQDSRDFGA